MIATHKIKILTDNWGEKAEGLACKAEVRVYDPLSSWECYIYAMNPEDRDEICCILNAETVEICRWNISRIFQCYNGCGEPPVLDKEYRPQEVQQILKKFRAYYDR